MKDCLIIASDNWWGLVTHVITYHRKRGHTLINTVSWFALYFTLFCEYYRVIEQVSPYSLLESGQNQFIVSSGRFYIHEASNGHFKCIQNWFVHKITF